MRVCPIKVSTKIEVELIRFKIKAEALDGSEEFERSLSILSLFHLRTTRCAKSGSAGYHGRGPQLESPRLSPRALSQEQARPAGPKRFLFPARWWGKSGSAPYIDARPLVRPIPHIPPRSKGVEC